jgi:hypothetical protein
MLHPSSAPNTFCCFVLVHVCATQQLKDMQKEVLRYKRSDGVDLTGAGSVAAGAATACADQHSS